MVVYSYHQFSKTSKKSKIKVGEGGVKPVSKNYFCCKLTKKQIEFVRRTNCGKTLKQKNMLENIEKYLRSTIGTELDQGSISQTFYEQLLCTHRSQKR